jgi:polyhydroxyalkanoate synthesis regulator phasin
VKRRRDRKPFTLEEARRRLSDLLWQIDYLVHQRDDLDLAEACRALHAFAQGASVLKSLYEAEALEELAALKDRVNALESDQSRLSA